MSKKDDDGVIRFLEGVRRRCPEMPAVLEALGDLYTKVGRVEEGLSIDRELTVRDPANATYWYNLACSLSLVGQPDDALSALAKAVQCGYDDWKWMQQDDDLGSIRQSPAFEALIALIKNS